MPSVAGLLTRHWATLHPDTLANRTFEPQDGIPRSSLRRSLLPTLLAGGPGLPGIENSRLRGRIAKGYGTIDEHEATVLEEWFRGGGAARIDVCAAWHTRAVSEYARLRKLARQGRVVTPIPDLAQAPSELLVPSARLAETHGQPREDGWERHVHDEFEAMARGRQQITDARGLDRELRLNRVRYERLLDEAWQSPSLNGPAGSSPTVDALLAEILSAAGHVDRGGTVHGVLLDERRDAADRAWQALLADAQSLDGHRRPRELSLSSDDPIGVPSLTGAFSGLPPLDEPLRGRITNLLRPNPLPRRPDSALETAIASSAEPLGLGLMSSRATMLLAAAARRGIDAGLPREALVSPGERALSAALRRSGVIAMLDRDVVDPAFDSVSRRVRSQEFVARWLGRVWGAIWRRELADDPLESLEDAWALVVRVANSAGSALQPHVGSGVAEAAPLDPLALLSAAGTPAAAFAFVRRVAAYSSAELNAVRQGATESLPSTYVRDLAEWDGIRGAYARKRKLPESALPAFDDIAVAVAGIDLGGIGDEDD